MYSAGLNVAVGHGRVRVRVSKRIRVKVYPTKQSPKLCSIVCNSTYVQGLGFGAVSHWCEVIKSVTVS